MISPWNTKYGLSYEILALSPPKTLSKRTIKTQEIFWNMFASSRLNFYPGTSIFVSSLYRVCLSSLAYKCMRLKDKLWVPIGRGTLVYWLPDSLKAMSLMKWHQGNILHNFHRDRTPAVGVRPIKSHCQKRVCIVITSKFRKDFPRESANTFAPKVCKDFQNFAKISKESPFLVF